MKILMVCLGNICRSPLAEGILLDKLNRSGIEAQVDSAGVGNYHVGELPDQRAISVARKNAIDITGQRARQITRNDFSDFDLILTMDASVHRSVLQMIKNNEDAGKVHLFLEYANIHHTKDVPDPYFGGDDGFTQVFNLISSACDNIINRMKHVG